MINREEKAVKVKQQFLNYGKKMISLEDINTLLLRKEIRCRLIGNGV